MIFKLRDLSLGPAMDFSGFEAFHSIDWITRDPTYRYREHHQLLETFQKGIRRTSAISHGCDQFFSETRKCEAVKRLRATGLGLICSSWDLPIAVLSPTLGATLGIVAQGRSVIAGGIK